MQNRRKSSNSKRRIIFPLTAAAVSGLSLGMIFFSLLALILCKVDVPAPMLTPISTVAASLAVLLTAAVFSLLYGERGMLYGFMIGAFVFIVLLAASLLQGKTEITALAAIKGMALVLSGAAGGCLGISLREKRRIH